MRRLLAWLLALGGLAPLCAGDWVLGASAFTFTQYYDERSSAQEGMAALIPQLVLEQVAAGSVRMPPDSELLDRALEELLTERISLFLQLSREVRARDALVLTETHPRRLRKKIAAEEEKIRDIQSQIDGNLSRVDRAKAEYRERTLHRDRQEQAGLPLWDRLPFNAFFARREEAVLERPQSEAVSLYRGEASALYVPPDEALEAGPESREFERAMADAQINGLITGRITGYGGYVSVTAELRVFPGGRVAGTITEVGTLDDTSRLAEEIARYLLPAVANSRPVRLYLDVAPAEAAAAARVTVDGVVEQLDSGSLLLAAGVHTIQVESEGYAPQSVTYQFQDVPTFFVHVSLEPEADGTFTVGVRNPQEGSLYANGQLVGTVGAGTVSAPVTVNGAPVMGQFLGTGHAVRTVRREVAGPDGRTSMQDVQEEGGPLGSFFYVPESLQEEGAELMVSVNPVDTAALIDRRRIWMYRGYSALVLSLPFTVFCFGKFNTAYVAYYKGYMGLEEARRWEVLRWVSAGISIAAGSFFVFELVRYLRAANSVLPVEAKPARAGEAERALERSQELRTEPPPGQKAEAFTEAEDADGLPAPDGGEAAGGE